MPYADPAEQRQYQAEWMARRRAGWFAGKACVDCGGDGDLTLDHQDPATKVSHRIWSWSSERRDVELTKCVVRCDPCHRLKTRANREDMGQATLTIAEVEEIRGRYAAGGETQGALGREFKISQSAVSRIVRHRRWVVPS